MKKFVLVAVVMFLFLGCSATRIDDPNNVYKPVDCGKLQLSENVYVKKISLGDFPSSDRIYLLVDKNDKIISDQINVSIEVPNGKTTRTESYMIKE